jgi:hypothetical protein
MKISENLKKQIIDWFESSQDFNTGLILLQQCIRNKALIRNISRPNSHNQKKIAWELRKAAGLPENICQAENKKTKKNIPLMDLPLQRMIKRNAFIVANSLRNIRSTKNAAPGVNSWPR